MSAILVNGIVSREVAVKSFVLTIAITAIVFSRLNH